MDEEHAMTSGLVPVRPPSYFPRLVKLPRRFEKAALGDPKTARYRKVSLCGAPLHMRQSISDRMDDLMTAIMWVKQEMICLRQHDILLKRQFFDIHNSIQSLQRSEIATSASTHSLSTSPTSSLPCNDNNNNATTKSGGQISDHNGTISSSSKLPNSTSSSSQHISSSSSPSPVQSPLTFKKKRLLNGMSSLCSSQSFLLDGLSVRVSSSSATVLNHLNGDNSDDDNDDDTDGDDTFDSNFFRPRTSSMRTSRDMAALARRRGSKDLV